MIVERQRSQLESLRGSTKKDRRKFHKTRCASKQGLRIVSNWGCHMLPLVWESKSTQICISQGPSSSRNARSNKWYHQQKTHFPYSHKNWQNQNYRWEGIQVGHQPHVSQSVYPKSWRRRTKGELGCLAKSSPWDENATSILWP